jgi:hypothetical protein
MTLLSRCSWVSSMKVCPVNWPAVSDWYGCWCAAYNLQQWYFEVVSAGWTVLALMVPVVVQLDMGHKLVMTSLLAFLPIDTQMPIGMFVVMTYLWILLLMQPYLRRDDDMLHLFVQIELYLIVLAGSEK